MITIGLYIGRFQPFHNGHKKIVDTMLKENEAVIILIGLSKDEARNPYDYNTRLHFFTHTYSNTDNIVMYPLPDEKDDRDWVHHILSFPEIQSADIIQIYGGDIPHDSAIQSIKKHQGLFENREIHFKEISRKNTPISGTKIRNNIKDNGIHSIETDVPKDVFEYLKTF